MGGNGIRSKSVSNMTIRECILCGLVYLAPARCAHEKIVRTVGEIRNLTKSYYALSAVVSTLYDTTL